MAGSNTVAARDMRQMVPSEAVMALIDSLQAIGHDVPRALASAGVARSDPHVRRGEGIRLTREAFARLAREAIIALDEEACRREGMRAMPYPLFRLMCIAMLGCPNLKTGIDVICDVYGQNIGGYGSLTLAVSRGMATLTLDMGKRKRDVVNLLVTMYALSSFHRLFGWLSHTEIPVAQVALNFPRAIQQPAFNMLLQIEPDFDQPANTIRFSSALLTRPIWRQYHELEDLLSMFPFDLLPPTYDEGNLAERIRSATMSVLSSREPLPGALQFARMFGLSLSTLRRRLIAENSSIVRIRNECRFQVAEQLLGQTRLTVKEIATRARFDDVATFRRAFRAWKGMSPNAFRAEQAGLEPHVAIEA